jgi:hypothetical protein
MPDTKDKERILDKPLTPTKKETKKAAMIYAGPTVSGVVVSGSVFINGLPANVEEATKKCPSIKELIVPVKDVNKIRKELTKKDGAVKRFYEEVKKFRG